MVTQYFLFSIKTVIVREIQNLAVWERSADEVSARVGERRKGMRTKIELRT